MFVMSTIPPDTQNIALEIPREIPFVTRMTPVELKRELAFALYAQDKISLGKARELAELTVWQFQDGLAARAIPPHYDLEEFAEDVAALREVERL